MNQELISKRLLIFAVITALAALTGWMGLLIFDTRTTVVFCDIGQGDGSYIRLYNKIDIVIDAGPNKAMLSCLGKYMPFFDKTIEVAILSHPHQDHIGGFEDILKRYTVKLILLPPVKESSQLFERIHEEILAQQIPYMSPVAGDVIKLDQDAGLSFIWPTQYFINDRVLFRKNEYFGTTQEDLNSLSLVMYLYFKDKEILYTGDALPKVWNVVKPQNLHPVTILKVPHHGSENGLTEHFLQAMHPVEAVISVGKKNRFDHPSESIIELLEKYDVPIRRTDHEGNIVYRWN